MKSTTLFSSPIRFPRGPDWSLESFVSTGANKTALEHVLSWPDNWGIIEEYALPGITFLRGPVGCGKTHLSTIWQARSGAHFVSLQDVTDYYPAELVSAWSNLIIDDFDRYFCYNESYVLHIINNTISSDSCLLITSTKPLVDLSLQLPDLISRLRSVIQINIGDPEEHLMACMMSKLFCDIQLKVKRRVIDYAVKHIERSYRAVIDFVSKADLLSMEGKCNVDIGLAKKILNMHV